MTYKEIQELIKLVNKMNLSEFKLKDGDLEMSIRTKDYSKTKRIVSDNPQVISVAPQAAPVQQIPVAPQTTAVPDLSPNPANSQGENNNAGLIEVKSPIVGTFYRSSSPDKPPFVKVGDKIEVGDVVCIVEAMKLFNEIESEVAGTVVKVLSEDASPVEYDQALFLLEP